MLYTILHVYISEGFSDMGFQRGINEEGFEWAEAIAKVIAQAECALGNEGTMKIEGAMRRGSEDDGQTFKVTVEDSDSKQLWVVCGE